MSELVMKKEMSGSISVMADIFLDQLLGKQKAVIMCLITLGFRISSLNMDMCQIGLFGVTIVLPNTSVNKISLKYS